MSNYTPVFKTVFDGTLCGKWPTLPVWLTLLPLADWRGHIDMTPEAIAVRTGWPIDLLLHGIKELCLPDPRSRSKNDDGRRLALISSERDWGWKVVNIQTYRNKASGTDQVVDGRNAEKVRRYKKRHRETLADTTGHQTTPRNTNVYVDINKDKKKTEEAQAPVSGLDIPTWDRWFSYRKQSGKPIKPASITAAQRKLAAFGIHQALVVEDSIANGYQGLFAPKTNGTGGRVTEWE